MDQADIKLPPLRDGKQINPTLGSPTEKGTQVRPPPAQTVAAWGRPLPCRRTNLHTQVMAEYAPVHL